MSVKYFCDLCDSPIRRNFVVNRYKPSLRRGAKLNKVNLEVIVTINGITNQGEICLDCLKFVIMHGKEDP